MRRMCGLDLSLVRLRCRYPLCAVIRPPQTGGKKQITVDGRISTLVDAGCALHVREIDTPTLSTECQKPCQKPSNRIQDESQKALRPEPRAAFSLSWRVHTDQAKQPK